MVPVRLFKILPVLLLAACTHARGIPLTQSGTVRYPPKDPTTVGVFRSMIPFARYEEMGLITVRLSSGNVKDIYDELRLGAAEMGADAVVGMNIDERFHAEAQEREVCTSRQTCVPQSTCPTDGGPCTTENACTSTPACTTVREPPNTTTYLGIGTMIRRAK